MIEKTIISCVILVLLAVGSAAAEIALPSVVKVPCRDMGDGRILIDSLYLPDGYDFDKHNYSIIKTQPTSMQNEWANLVCTIEIK